MFQQFVHLIHLLHVQSDFLNLRQLSLRNPKTAYVANNSRLFPILLIIFEGRDINLKAQPELGFVLTTKRSICEYLFAIRVERYFDTEVFVKPIKLYIEHLLFYHRRQNRVHQVFSSYDKYFAIKDMIVKGFNLSKLQFSKICFVILQFEDYQILMRRFTSQHKSRKDHAEKNVATNSISFNAFTFVDSITNNKIILKDAHEQYSRHGKHFSQEIQLKKREVDQLANCISLLKTTKMFQMDSLRQKMFKTAYHSRQPTLDSEQAINLTKRELQKIIKTSIEDLSRKELSQWLNGSSKHIDPKIMGLQSLSGHKLTKSNLLQLINGSQKTIDPPKAVKLAKENKSVHLRQQKELKEKLQQDIAAIKANNTFLVRPDSKHELYEKLYTACARKGRIKRTAAHNDTFRQTNTQGVFRPIQVGNKLLDLQGKIAEKQKKSLQPQEQREIIFAVENSLFFDMQFLLNTKKHLINSKDRKGNNLLHIAAKNRNLQFFQFLLKRSNPQALEAKNNLGKTPLQVAKLYGISGIVDLINNYTPFQ